MYRYVKRTADFTVALLLLTVLSPLMLISACLIAVNRDGPILFKQKRPGKNGKIFTVYKFRTMSTKTHDKDGNELSDFERMTGIGKFLRKTSIDELPQLLNILKGDMSFIGPRPLLPEYLPERLAEAMRPEEDALWLSDETGRVHPLCGLYRKRICAEVEAQILAGCLRVMELEKHIRVRALPAGELGISDMELLNCNVPERYELACSLAQKKSGKPEGKEDERWTRRKT